MKEEVCMAGDRSCIVVDSDGLDGVMKEYSWVSYMSDTPVRKREMPIAAKFRNFRDELVYQYCNIFFTTFPNTFVLSVCEIHVRLYI